MMSLDFTVKVVDVHKDNITTIWPCLKHAIQSASFVALDCVSNLIMLKLCFFIE